MLEKFPDEYERHMVTAFSYQLIMRKGWSDYAMLINFDCKLRALLPLATSSKFGSEDFQVPISILMGDRDWMLKADKGASEDVIAQNKKKHGYQSNYYIVPNAGHTLHVDNAEAIINILLNDIFYSHPDQEKERLPVISNL